jgi:hypothetical protein
MVNIFLYLLIFLSEVDELVEEENVIRERQMSGGSSEGATAVLEDENEAENEEEVQETTITHSLCISCRNLL